jgi:hypothetical protein
MVQDYASFEAPDIAPSLHRGSMGRIVSSQLDLSHNSIDGYFKQTMIERTHMQHMAPLLLEHVGHVDRDPDLLKACLQVEFEPSFDRALAA